MKTGKIKKENWVNDLAKVLEHENNKPKGILYKTTCYLQGPIEFAIDASSWRNKAIKELKKMGVRCFDPLNKPFINQQEETEEVRKNLKKLMSEGKLDEVYPIAKAIRSEDLRYCDTAGFGICYINPKVFTGGTIEEAAWMAGRLRKPVYVFIEGGRNFCPIWVLAIVGPNYVFDSLDDIIKELNLINNGQKEPDRTRWRFFKEEFL